MVGSPYFHTIRFRALVSAIAVTAVLTTFLPAIAQTASPIPNLPSRSIFDSAHILNAETEQELAVKLKAALDDNGLELIIATYDFVLRESLQDCATALLEERSTRPHTIVLALDCSSNSISLVGSHEFQEILPRVGLESIFQRSAEQVQRHFRSHPSQNESLDQAELVHLTVDALLSDPVLLESFRNQNAVVFTTSTLQLLISFTIGVICLAVGTFEWERRRGQQQYDRQRRGYFPTTTVPRRLGADLSGGVSGTLGQSDH